MEQIDRIRRFLCEQKFEQDVLYLVEKLSDDSGLFIQNSQIVFAKFTFSKETVIIETSQLKLIQNISIDSTNIDSTFGSGNYDLILYKGNCDDSNAQAFVNLCSSFIKLKEISFHDFFHSLVKLFKVSGMEEKNNFIGLWGEFYIIHLFWTKYGIDIAKYWHYNGPQSTFDFLVKDTSIEIKTSTTNNNTFKIKHSQLFDYKQTFLVILNINSGGSYSLIDFNNYFDNNEPFSSDFNFKLQRIGEMMRINDHRLLNLKQSCNRLMTFKNTCLESIQFVPDCISNIVYDYNFDPKKSTDMLDLVNHIKERK